MPARVAIIGATATGKTKLAIALANAIDGEIINADSRQIYRGMDIGTAKPTAPEQTAARHWLVDIAEPAQPFTLADFLDRATVAMGDIASRGRVPIIAGGTGQYVWALLEGWSVPRVAPDPGLRAHLEDVARHEGYDALASRLRAIDPASAENIDPRNVRRVIRAIEVATATGRPFSEWRWKADLADGTTVIGLRMQRDALYRRIDARVDAMMAAGFVAEVESLLANGYDCLLPSMSGIGYRQLCDYLRGECSLDAAVMRIKTETHRLARMQNTWFRETDERITWLDADDSDLVERALDVVRSEAPL